jgi:hypothetical protein
MAFRVIKQLYPEPSSSATFTDPPWAKRQFYIASASNMQLWEFDSESDANAKAAELSGSDSSGRTYKVIEI